MAMDVVMLWLSMPNVVHVPELCSGPSHHDDEFWEDTVKSVDRRAMLGAPAARVVLFLVNCSG